MQSSHSSILCTVHSVFDGDITLRYRGTDGSVSLNIEVVVDEATIASMQLLIAVYEVLPGFIKPTAITSLSKDIIVKLETIPGLQPVAYPLAASDTSILLSSLICSLAALHSHDHHHTIIRHDDIKPSNIFFNPAYSRGGEKFKLVGFGRGR